MNQTILAKSNRNERVAKAISLIELLVSTLIVGIAAAGISGALLLNNISSVREFNKVDNLNAARHAIERMGKDIRSSRNVGDVYGNQVLLYSGPPEVWGTEGASQFPSTMDPHYNGGQVPLGGWPAAPWPTRPYVLSPQTLIVQLPVFDAQGFPTKVSADQYGAGNPPAPQDNMDTVVYQVVVDPDKTGEFMLQVAGFPGSPSSLKLAANPPQNILKGIVGPMDRATGLPKVFQYLNKYDPSGTPQDTVAGNQITNYTGVVVNFELKSASAGETGVATVGLKSEIFMRNNTLSVVSGS